MFLVHRFRAGDTAGNRSACLQGAWSEREDRHQALRAEQGELVATDEEGIREQIREAADTSRRRVFHRGGGESVRTAVPLTQNTGMPQTLLQPDTHSPPPNHPAQMCRTETCGR